MTPRMLLCALVLISVVGLAWSRFHEDKPVVLSLRIGQPFDEVVGGSTFPVLEKSGNPADYQDGGGFTIVDKPSVIIRFNDPAHGFTLPPTKFAMIGYAHSKVETIATSPMLEMLPFDEAVTILENLQNQFKSHGWEPWPGDGSKWFDFTPTGRKHLYRHMFESGWAEQASLRVPNKYAMTFRIKCANGCDDHKKPYLFLIDIGVSDDTYAEFGRPDKGRSDRARATLH